MNKGPPSLPVVADDELNDVFADNKHEITRLEQNMTEMLHKMNTMKKQAQENVAAKEHLLIRNKKIIEIETDFQTLNSKSERSFLDANEKTEAEFKKKREELEIEYLRAKEKNKTKYQHEVATVRGQYLDQKQVIETKWAEILGSFSDLTRKKIMQYEQERLSREEASKQSPFGTEDLAATNKDTKYNPSIEKKYNDSPDNEESENGTDTDLPMPDYVCKSKNVVAEITRFASCVLIGESASGGALERMNVDEIAKLLFAKQKPLPPAILRLIEQEKAKLPPIPSNLTGLIKASHMLHFGSGLPATPSVPLEPVHDDD